MCQKSFNRSTSLKNNQTIHTGEKSFSCKICTKTFRLNCSLKTHSLIYSCDTVTEEKSYSCEICKQAFPKKVYLVEHYHIHMDQMHPKKLI